MSTIEVKRDIREENRLLAEKLKALYKAKKVFVINIMGSPGAGKTTFMENILPSLAKRLRVAVIEGDIATDNDAKRMERAGINAVQINTDGACHLDSLMIKNMLGHIDLDSVDILIIENVGNLVCPVNFELGEQLRVVIISTAEGEDKPQKYPNAVLKTDALIISKTDIARYVGADINKMKCYINEINPKVHVFEAGIENGEYRCDGFAEYLIEEINKAI